MGKIFSFHASTTRSVILVHPLKIALKFPRFDFWSGMKTIFKWVNYSYYVYIRRDKLQMKNLRYELKWGVGGPVDIQYSLSYRWFRGIMANINEMRFCWGNIRNPFMIPTYFSFFGLMNIQPLIVPIPELGCKLHEKFIMIIDQHTEMFEDNHAWEDRNFTIRKDGTVAVYDYGSSRAFPMVKKYGRQFSRVLITAQ